MEWLDWLHLIVGIGGILIFVASLVWIRRDTKRTIREVRARTQATLKEIHAKNPSHVDANG